MGTFYPLMKKSGYGLPGKDAIVVWWGALRGAIGLALALVVYTENFRYEFSVAMEAVDTMNLLHLYLLLIKIKHANFHNKRILIYIMRHQSDMLRR